MRLLRRGLRVVLLRVNVLTGRVLHAVQALALVLGHGAVGLGVGFGLVDRRLLFLEAHGFLARQLARDLGRSSQSEVYELRCVLTADDAARRIRARASAGVDASDATPEVAAAMAALADPWVESAELRTDRQAAEVTQAAADLCAIPQISSDLPPDGDFP